MLDTFRGDEKLKRLATSLRTLPEGSSIQVVIESQQFILPWALIYDKPGPVTVETLDWRSFWGYRFLLDTLPPGEYPSPIIDAPPLNMQILLNDDANLRDLTHAQEEFIRQWGKDVLSSVAWGTEQVTQALLEHHHASLIYLYCHGMHASGVIKPGAFVSESALYFGGKQPIDLNELRNLVSDAFPGQPLVFLNACEGGTQDVFYYDGFMPFFVEERGARGFIGTEVKTPQLLAHDFALNFLRSFAQGEPIGQILWQLRRHYLNTHHTILAFNYSLYGLNEIRLATPLPPAARSPDVKMLA